MTADRTTPGGEQRGVRVAKLERLRAEGIAPWAERFERTHSLAQARALPEGTEGVCVAGRITGMRVMGRLSFATLQDQSGRCQVWVQLDEVGEHFYKQVWKKLVDIGDFIGVSGYTAVTKTGEPTVAASEVTFLGKALRPLPEKFHGLTDRELSYRQRYLDLMTNRGTLERFLLRTRIVRAMRTFLEEHGFEEVETPVLQTRTSGAAARPFRTHHNAFDMDVSLRIAPETWLKRLIVGGYDRVFEFARCFRNEGLDPSHLQDFTMLEFYAAYWNYEDNMDFTRELIQHTLRECMGTLKLEVGGRSVDFSGEWPRVRFRDLLLRDSGIDIEKEGTVQELRDAVRGCGIELADVDIDKLGYGSLADQIYKKVSRPRLVDPVFVIGHPVELSPLARRNHDEPELADRFQLVVRGWEVVNAYSELVDPLDQRARLEAQASLRAWGDEEAMEMDEDYLQAMEYGMPPVSGFGLGVDRFTALVTDQENLRDVVLFPLMKPQE